MQSGRAVDVNGAVWHVATSDSSPNSAVWFSGPDGAGLVVSGVGIDDQTMLDVVGSLEMVSAIVARGRDGTELSRTNGVFD